MDSGLEVRRDWALRAFDLQGFSMFGQGCRFSCYCTGHDHSIIQVALVVKHYCQGFESPFFLSCASGTLDSETDAHFNTVAFCKINKQPGDEAEYYTCSRQQHVKFI